ncbi:MAG: hypothetical protein Kow0025_15130 [Thermodesulfovibrionales bacterium]
MRIEGVARLAFALALASAVLFAGCGKKTPPRLPVYEKPGAPRDLRAIHREGEIILRWKRPKDAASLEGFVVLRAEDGGFRKLAETREPIYIDRDFETGRIYRYKVVALGLRGVLGEDSPALEAAPAAAPEPPVDLALKVTPEGVRLSWRHPGPALFNVYRSPAQGRQPLSPLNPAPLEGLSYGDPAAPAETVYYTVRALRPEGMADESAPSAEARVSPKDFVPSAVAGLEAVSTEHGVMLIWDESPERWVKGYRIYAAREGEGFAPAGRASTPAFTVPPAPGLEGRAALYIVNAVGPIAESPSSAPVSVSPAR